MLSPKTQLNLRNAKAYFREHLSAGDYYAQSHTVSGEWFGLGAEKLGLRGVVTEAEFLRLCEGRHPKTGRRLTRRLNTDRRQNGASVANRRVFYDFTISPPKSVSVVALMGDRRIVRLHDEAVRTAMAELEPLALARVRKGGAFASRPTGNVIGAAFRHDTSRELDPHLHTHCVLLNATFDPVEHQWKALEAAELFRAQKMAEQCYFHELCRGLRKLGYAIEPTARNFEIKGVPESVLARFSKRRAQIDAEAKRQLARQTKGEPLPAVRARVARESRPRKVADSTADRLRGYWLEQLTKPEKKALEALPRESIPAPADVAALLAWADEHVFERKAVATEYEVLAAALAHGRGLNFDPRALRDALRTRDYLREAESPKLASRAALRCELEVVLAARDGRGLHAPFAPGFKPTTTVSDEQERAIRHLLTSRDFITLFRGGAGTGKSFALREVHRGLIAAGHPVLVLAPQRQQALDLTRDGLPAETLAAVLARGDLPKRAAVIVDEAGQIGGRDLRSLMHLARRAGARLILSGDTRQHGAVAASDALRAIEAYGQLVPAEITTIRRQDPKRAASTAERVQIERYRAAVKCVADGDVAASFAVLDRLGWVHEAGDADRHRRVAREFVAAQSKGESVLAVAPTWSEVHALNAAVRRELAKNSQLGPDTTVTTFEAVDSTAAQRRDPAFYRTDHAVHFVRRYGRYSRGEVCPVVGASEKGLVLLKNGRRSTMSLRYADRIAVVRPVELAIAVGDRLQLKFNGRTAEGAWCANGELVTVRTVYTDGRVLVRTDAGAEKTLSPQQRVFNLGYAITSYGSQGKTVDTVLLSDGGQSAATNQNQWYVSISRGRKRALVFTADKAALQADIARSGARPLALDLDASSAPEASRPAWLRRVRAAIDTAHRISFLAHQRATAPAQRRRL